MADTPLMIQYREMKKQYPDMVLFFRLGDFYEMFDEDAVEVSSLLNLTLTHRGDSPMCGIPYHAAKNYIKRLLDCSKKIAVCEQLELSNNSKSLAKREVVRIITPATIVDEDFLDSVSFNWILCVFRTSCAFCDVSTGEFHMKNLDKSNRVQAIRTLVEQLKPKEILVCEDEYFMDLVLKEVLDNSHAMLSKLPPWYFSIKTCFNLLCEKAGVKSLSSFGIDDKNAVISPAGALVKYIGETSKTSVSYLTNYTLDTDDMYVSMDESSRKNLELFRNLYDGSSKNTLFDSINMCRSASGTRLLKSWLSFPLKDLSAIVNRQNRVKYFYENEDELKRVRSLIASSLDLNRLTTRVLLKRCSPHDLIAIKQSIGTFFDLVSTDYERYSSLFENILFDHDNLQKAVDLMHEIDKAINEDALGVFTVGNVILDGYDSDLDEKRKLKNNSDAILKQYLEEEKQNSGITILKLGYNKVFGYFLEVPNGQLSKIPSYFLRKQTLVNGERFTTEKLQSYEHEILVSTTASEEREKYLYENILSMVVSSNNILNSIGHFMSLIDVYQALATLALKNNYVCPLVTEQDILEIKGGRHPVVENMLPGGQFVANDLNAKIRFSLITGPNMAGKSTYLRQNALIILLSHIGSFVPAESAKIGLVDKIFCRVGASDNLARGESTFLLEMQEASFILRTCTERSFVIVDEIGRGTSTQDGMSIAYAVMNELIRKNVKTLFATHYHELTMMDISGIRLLTLKVLEDKGNVIFLRKVIDGVANSSYGIHVAKLAGMPSSVIKEAKQFQSRHFADYSMQQNSLFTNESNVESGEDLSDYAFYKDICSSIAELDTDQMTPMQAMLALSQLKEKTKDMV